MVPRLVITDPDDAELIYAALLIFAVGDAKRRADLMHLAYIEAGRSNNRA